MSRRSVAWRKRFNQALGNNYEQGGRELRRVFIRDEDHAISVLLPRHAKGKKSEVACTHDMTSEKSEYIRKLLTSIGKGIRR